MTTRRFLLVWPVVAAAWLGLGASPLARPTVRLASPPQASRARIGNIAWQGNRLLSASQLNQALGLRPGDPYDSAEVQTHLARRPDAHDIPSRYLDHGYFFFAINTVVLHHPSGITDLTFILNEGRPTQWGAISITGSHQAPTADLLAQLPLRTGDLCSRSKLLQAQQLLAASGFFEPTKIGIVSRPIRRPRDFTDLVDVEFTVLER